MLWHMYMQQIKSSSPCWPMRQTCIHTQMWCGDVWRIKFRNDPIILPGQLHNTKESCSLKSVQGVSLTMKISHKTYASHLWAKEPNFKQELMILIENNTKNRYTTVYLEVKSNVLPVRTIYMFVLLDAISTMLTWYSIHTESLRGPLL